MVGGRACSNLFFFSMGRDSSAGYWNPETLLRWWVPELSWGLSFTFWLIFLHVFSKSMSMLLATLVLLLVYTSFFFPLDQTMNFSLLNMMRFDLHEPGGNKECSGSLGEWVPPCKATASGEVITRYLSKKCARWAPYTSKRTFEWVGDGGIGVKILSVANPSRCSLSKFWVSLLPNQWHNFYIGDLERLCIQFICNSATNIVKFGVWFLYLPCGYKK